ncbi:MAG: hypothetical protein H0T68_13430, partial [Gemmatimonadales bacterium]|nr:hypothetical protein [Gemmatimonadales bacterium]
MTGDYPPARNRLLQLAELLPHVLAELKSFLLQYPGLRSREVIAPFAVPYVLMLEGRAWHSPYPPLHSLIGYFSIDGRGQLDALGLAALQSELQAIPSVDLVYPETDLRAAAPVTPGNETMYPQAYHGHFHGSFEGINAVAPTVWGLYDGSGVGFVDLEAGWNLNHVDLPQPPPPVFNSNVATAASHGTAVLGIVVGQDNSKGIVGIAPGAKVRKLASHIQAPAPPNDMSKWEIAPAILDSLSPG